MTDNLYFPKAVFPLDVEEVIVPDDIPPISPHFGHEFNIAALNVLQILVGLGTDEEMGLDSLMLLLHRSVAEVTLTAAGVVEDSTDIPGFNTLEEDLADLVIAVMTVAAIGDFSVGNAVYRKIQFLKDGGNA